MSHVTFSLQESAEFGKIGEKNEREREREREKEREERVGEGERG